MLVTRTFGRWTASALLVCSLTLPAAADGLSRFEEAIKQAPSGSFAYKSGKSLGDSGFALEGVTLTPPPDATGGAKAEPIAIKRISVEDFDFASVDKNVPPNFIRMRIEGIAIGPKPADGVDLKEMIGLDKVTADFQLDYRVDPARKTMTLNRLELDLNGLARLELSMVLDGVNPEAVDSAANDATLRAATLVYDDRSLLGKVLPAAAKMQGADADGVVKMAKAGLDGVRAGQGPAALAVLDALASYVEDYKQPKGALKITLTPTAKTTVASLSDLKDPDEAIKALGLVVSYPGTRPGAPAAAAASAPAGGSKSSCAAGSRLFVMRDDAWWSVTVRDATKSGDKCVARIDGGDDDVIFSLADTLAWSIDGPGKPLDSCKRGDKVLAAYKDGGWYPAKVAGDAPANTKCPVRYDDGDEDKLDLKRVRRID